jgi:hypothetical protein
MEIKMIRTEKDRKKELERLCGLKAEDFIEHLANSIIATNIVVNGFTLGNGFQDDSANIMFIGILDLRDSLIDSMEWVRVNVMGKEIEYEEEEIDEDQDEEDKDDL